MIMTTINVKKFFVQETIGGWKQTPCFEGTLEECEKFVIENNSNRSLFVTDNPDVDYL